MCIGGTFAASRKGVRIRTGKEGVKGRNEGILAALTITPLPAGNGLIGRRGQGKVCSGRATFAEDCGGPLRVTPLAAFIMVVTPKGGVSGMGRATACRKR